MEQMRTIIISIIIALPLIMGACGNQVKDSSGVNELVKEPGDPTGDTERDGKAIAEYVYALLPRLDSLDRKLEAHQDLMMNNTYNEGLSEVFKRMINDTTADYNELPALLKTEYPVGDMRKDGETLAYIATKVYNYKADFGKITDRYDVYYKAKGMNVYHQYRASVRRNLPKDFEPALFTDLSEEEYYPEPDPLEVKTYGDQENMPVCFAFVGRFATYDELRQSPFYGYLCQRIPELSQCTEFTVNTTDKVDDVWMLIPTIENVWCKIKAFTPDMLTHHERTDNAKVYYTSENMKPILIHTSMDNQGSIIVDYSASATDGKFGANTALFCVPSHTEPEKELKLVTFDYGEDTVYISIPTAVAYVSQGNWWKGKGNDLFVKLTANGQVSIKDNSGKEINCSYINYHHNKRSMMAVKTDDGKQRAVWEWELYDGEGGPTKLALTQLKGTILPESNKQLFFIDPNKAGSKN